VTASYDVGGPAAVAQIASRIQAIRQRFDAPTAQVATDATTADEFAATLAGLSSSTESSATSAAAGTPSGADVVTDAMRYLGVPYLRGGDDPAKGLDCSGLVQRVYDDLGITLPPVSWEQAKVGQPVASLADAKPGDLVAFNSPVSHIGIYIGNGKMINAPHTGAVVRIQDVKNPTTIRRIIPDQTAPAFIGGASLLGIRPLALASAATSAAGTIGSAPSGPAAFAGLFNAAEARYNLPTGLLSAVAKVESNYRPDAVSSAGAIGMMQLMPATARAYGVDARDPVQAIDAAGKLLRGQLNRFGSVELALAAYNAGGPAVARYDGIPPYAQTQNYVRKVMNVLSGLGEAA
jgi:cell wall-associated NlpC family hydrolase